MKILNNKNIKSLIEYIPDFLKYCKTEKHFLPKSIENYQRFLIQFINWLKYSNQTSLLPYELSPTHIQQYKSYLSKRINLETKQPISNTTQNLYFIALRALLLYCVEKNIPSPSPDKIKLLKQDKSPSINFLNLEQLEKLLQSPNISTLFGLRDKTILELLFSTGLKIAQIVALNRSQIKIEPGSKNLEIKISYKKEPYSRNVYLSKKATYWLKKYLKSRADENQALFINYRGTKNAPRRLTPRSIERNIKKYLSYINLPPYFTPEKLRSVYVLYLLNQDTKINHPLKHQTVITENYKFSLKLPTTSSSILGKSYLSSWNTIEDIINQEVLWLKENITVMPEGYRKNHSILNCDNCLLRKLAILIVSGKIKATEFRTAGRKNLWHSRTKKKNFQKIKRHGQEWHKKMMNIILNYFKNQKNKMVLEPILNYGRADLGICLNQNEIIYIEIGTVSLYKLWHNFSTMKNTTFLVVPSEEYAIEFKT